MVLLKIEDLHLSFHSLTEKIYAVRGVDFTIREGETVGIVGESGSGKSAMAKSIIGLNPITSSHVERGEIWYKGEDLLKKKERFLRRIRGREIAMIFQDPMAALNPTMRVGKQIAEGYITHHPRADKKKVYRQVLSLLAEVGIPEPAHCYMRYPHELSGGMRQRVMIATAIIAAPTILLADEPTTALDVTIQAQILDLLQSIQKKKKMSIILITHDLSIAADFCDRILVMYAGQIVEDAPIDELFRSPKHPYTKGLLESIPKLGATKNEDLSTISGSPPTLSHKNKGCSFYPRCPYALPHCQYKPPPLFAISDNRFSRCFLGQKEEAPSDGE